MHACTNADASIASVYTVCCMDACMQLIDHAHVHHSCMTDAAYTCCRRLCPIGAPSCRTHMHGARMHAKQSTWTCGGSEAGSLPWFVILHAAEMRHSIPLNEKTAAGGHRRASSFEASTRISLAGCGCRKSR